MKKTDKNTHTKLHVCGGKFHLAHSFTIRPYERINNSIAKILLIAYPFLLLVHNSSMPFIKEANRYAQILLFYEQIYFLFP